MPYHDKTQLLEGIAKGDHFAFAGPSTRANERCYRSNRLSFFNEWPVILKLNAAFYTLSAQTVEWAKCLSEPL